MKAFSERLRALRKKKKLTQGMLGKEVNVSTTTISYYEAGEREPSFETLIKLANFFDVSLDYLLGRVDNEKGTAEGMDLYFVGDDGETYGFTKKQVRAIANFLKIFNFDEPSASRENRKDA